MLMLNEELLLNQYAQGLIEDSKMLDFFLHFVNSESKVHFLEEVGTLITQSKPQEGDVEEAIKQSQLKPTFTPCVLLRKGIIPHQLARIAHLPSDEQEKSFILLLNLFKIAYLRRFEQEKGVPHKWWYWDLSDKQNLEKIYNLFSPVRPRL